MIINLNNLEVTKQRIKLVGCGDNQYDVFYYAKCKVHSDGTIGGTIYVSGVGDTEDKAIEDLSKALVNHIIKSDYNYELMLKEANKG